MCDRDITLEEGLVAAKHHITGEDCVIRTEKCKCRCHEPGVKMLHMIPCCDGGWKRRYVFFEAQKKSESYTSTEDYAIGGFH